MNGENGKKRVTVHYERPNALFEQWLSDLYLLAVNKGSTKQYMYKKALTALKKFPLPLNSGKACLVLDNFGPELRDFIDWKLKKHRYPQNEETGIQVPKPVSIQGSQPQRSKTQVSQIPVSQSPSSQPRSRCKGTPQKNEEKTAGSKRKGQPYVPSYRSGAYALLITLLAHEGHPDFAGFLTKAELLDQAQSSCDESLTVPKPGSRYTAWSSMSSVVRKGLISRTGNPAKFSLTPEGREMAVRLLQVDPSTATSSNQAATSSQVTASKHQISDDDDEMSPAATSKPISPYKNGAIKSPKPVSRKRAAKKATPIDDSPPPCSQENHVPYVAFSMQPGGFEIILLVDTSETTGNSNCNKTKAILEEHRVTFEVRRLKVGDFSWVARDNETKKELLLPFIVERKRMDDLGSSIKDGRFHEQKFRLKQSGITNLVYLVENYGNNEHLGLPLASVQQAAVNTRVVDGFQVKYTNDHAHSMLYLAAFTQTLTTIYKEKTLVSCLKSDLAEKDVGPQADVAFLITYEEFNKSSSKVRNFTVREMLIRQLLQLHGLSVEKALAIANLYPTPNALMSAFDTGGEDLLTNVPFGTNNRKLGPLISKALHRLYTARSLS